MEFTDYSYGFRPNKNAQLDKEMEKRTLKYVRYADDFSIYTKSKKRSKENREFNFSISKEQIKTTD